MQLLATDHPTSCAGAASPEVVARARAVGADYLATLGELCLVEAELLLLQPAR